MRRLFLTALVAAVISASHADAERAPAQREAGSAVQLALGGKLPTLSGATGWLNSQPLGDADLRGKVVLIDVWTYSCVNWLRSLPYVRVWAKKYKSQGLVVIGVHAPEFDFERSVENVRRAATEMTVDYPIAIDNDYAIWNALGNEYWPAVYIADARGRIRYHHFGEGDYAESERVIQRLLAEAGMGGSEGGTVSIAGTGLEAPADWANLQSNENYLGSARTENYSSLEVAEPGENVDYTAPLRLGLNHWALLGNWNIGKQAITANRPNARIRYRFHARDLHLVMGPPAVGVPVRFRVLMDGQPPGTGHGVDVNPDGYGTVTEPRLYQLIRQSGKISDRQFEVTFFDSGVRAYSFTFG